MLTAIRGSSSEAKEITHFSRLALVLLLVAYNELLLVTTTNSMFGRVRGARSSQKNAEAPSLSARSCSPLHTARSASAIDRRSINGGFTMAPHLLPTPTSSACPRVAQSTEVYTQTEAQAQQALADALVEYIAEGPLLASCGIDAAAVRSDAAEWLRLGRRLAEQLDFDHDTLDDIQKLRIYHYYLPVYFWSRAQLDAHRASGATTALVLGISAPQGCGKSTIVEQLEQLFNWLGSTAVSVSIDDFYLSYEDQNKLAAAHPDNRLLQLRGNAGTHDLELGAATLRQMRELRHPGTTAAVPRYNKSAYSGRGDRADPATWPQVTGPVEIVFFEGWMSGFAPVPDEAAAGVDPALAQVNRFLQTYKATWDSLVDSWLVIRIGDPQWVFKWRLQAEERMKASGKAGMTAEQIADFVSRFIPAYQAYLPGLYSKGPTTAQPGKTLIIEVDQNRSPVLQQPAPVV